MKKAQYYQLGTPRLSGRSDEGAKVQHGGEGGEREGVRGRRGKKGKKQRVREGKSARAKHGADAKPLTRRPIILMDPHLPLPLRHRRLPLPQLPLPLRHPLVAPVPSRLATSFRRRPRTRTRAEAALGILRVEGEGRIVWVGEGVRGGAGGVVEGVGVEGLGFEWVLVG